MDQQQSPLVKAAACELELLRDAPVESNISGARMPVACQRLMLSLPGNAACVDCASPNPEWASVSFGALICLRCSGRHRSYGVQTSFVRSVRMDSWTHEQVLAMLEGSNEQLKGFFQRHQLGNSSALSSKRYHTKAAKFYRDNLGLHVRNVANSGAYQGREASRQTGVTPCAQQSNQSQLHTTPQQQVATAQ